MNRLGRKDVFYLYLTLLWIYVKADEDPCLNHLTFDVTSLGSRNEKCGRLGNPMDRVCDYRLTSAWCELPFDGYLLNTCPTSGDCGTDFPFWLSDNLPDIADEIVNRTCCMKLLSDCCAENVTIQVKKCSAQKYVYYLQRLSQCDSVYCITTNLTCDQPTTSTSTTTSTTMTTSEKSVADEDKSKHLLTILSVVIGILLTIVISVLVVGILCLKKNSKVESARKGDDGYHVYINTLHSVPTSPPPLYTELQFVK